MAVKFSDGRDKVLDLGSKPTPRLTREKLVETVAKLVNDKTLAEIIVVEMFANVQKGSDARPMLESWDLMIAEEAAHVKAHRALSKAVNNRR